MSNHLEVSFNRKNVEAALLAFTEQFNRSPIAMRTTTKSPQHTDIAVRFLDLLNTTTPDPLTTALCCGFTKNDGHPIYKLFEEAKTRCAGLGYGVDIDATKGFSKIWMAPLVEMGSLEVISSLTHLPQAVKNTTGHFKHFGIHSFGLLGFDFHNKSINLYVMINKTGAPIKDYSPLLEDIAIKPDSFEVLKSCQEAHVLYYSFSWTSPKVERVCFATVCEHRKQVPAHLHPLISKCLNNSVFMHRQKMCVYSVAWSQTGHYFKFDNDYNGAQAIQLMEAGDVGVKLCL